MNYKLLDKYISEVKKWIQHSTAQHSTAQHSTAQHTVQLISKLKEIFQINQPDLDFGIYRILNSRSAEIKTFLEDTLPAKIHATLASTEQEIAVYNHLFEFFSRYYDNGDFISQRRYKNNTYAIPYAGEEVVLHWANKDQYYTKSGENFANYAFQLGNGKKVQFRLIEADTAKDNRKDNDATRLFALAELTTKTVLDDNGEESQIDLLPIEESENELIIRFEYKAFTKKELEGKKKPQEFFIESAVEKLKKFQFSDEAWLEIFSPSPTEKEKDRPLIKKYLTDYTQKNTADYFIHKDLGKFLNLELDFYIKNEVMNLDNIQAETAFAEIERNLSLIKTMKTVAQEIIAFLAQLENFQKKLWLKKKFVAGTHYLITLDHLSDKLIEQALANLEQISQWQQLFDVNASGLNAEKLCENYPHLVVDTSLFAPEFQAEVLKEIENLDEQTDGLLIHSDNFQALNLLQARYKEQVKCIYIDPPYNTNLSEIIYKNGYKHSSWISLLENRMEVSKNLLTDSGVFFGAIDNVEFSIFEMAIKNVFGVGNYISTIAVQHNPKGRDKAFFSDSHEYMLVSSKNKNATTTNRLSLSKEELDKKYKKSSGNDRYRELPLRRSGSEAQREDRPYMYFPILAQKSSLELSILPKDEYVKIYQNGTFNDNYIDELERKYDELGFFFILPIRQDLSKGRWRWGYDSCEKGINNKVLFAKKDKGKLTIYALDEADDTYLPKTFWYGEKYDASSKGTNILKNIIPKNEFDYPKSLYLVSDTITIGADNNSLILDYFGGSGTTAHAVINLNREDNGKRKYILVEQGEYFDSVLKPRVQKVVFSADWKDGKPKADNEGKLNGLSQIVKVLKLESYEDTLNNLELKKATQAGFNFDEEVANDYLLHYMLDVESRGSLLNSRDFIKPFDYQLNIATNSAGAYEAKRIDLVETFNYLLGLKVEKIEDNRQSQGMVCVSGKLLNNEPVLIIWRDCELVDDVALNQYLQNLPNLIKFKQIYINGDHGLASIIETENSKMQFNFKGIEAVFLERMFE